MVSKRAFTIVELLVVIVVVAILVTLSVVGYLGIAQKAIINSIQTDLSQANKAIEISKNLSTDNLYPASLSSLNLNASTGNSYTYFTPTSRRSYCLNSTNGSTTYSISNASPTVSKLGCEYNGVVAWLKFNGDTTDSSGFSNVANAMSGAALGQGQNGLANGAYVFDGVDDYIDVANKSVLNQPIVSVSLWVKRTGYNTSICNILRRDQWDAYAFMCGSSTDVVSFKMAKQPSGWVQTPNTTLLLNEWTHLVGTYDGNTLAIYKNGALGASIGSGAPISYGFNESLIIARDDAVSGRYLKGSIDDVRIYARALSPIEIQTIYNLGAQ